MDNELEQLTTLRRKLLAKTTAAQDYLDGNVEFRGTEAERLQRALKARQEVELASLEYETERLAYESRKGRELTESNQQLTKTQTILSRTQTHVAVVVSCFAFAQLAIAGWNAWRPSRSPDYTPQLAQIVVHLGAIARSLEQASKSKRGQTSGVASGVGTDLLAVKSIVYIERARGQLKACQARPRDASACTLASLAELENDLSRIHAPGTPPLPLVP